MIEVLKLIGSALVAAGATLLSLYLKRKWEKQDRNESKKDAMEEKIDELGRQLETIKATVDKLANDVDKLTNDLDREVIDTDLKSRCLQAGLREILYDRIKYLCLKYISEGKIREEEYKSLSRMWRVYHEELEGNGYLDGEMKEIDKLEKY